MTTYVQHLDTIFAQAVYLMRDPSMVQFFIWVTQLGSSSTVIGLALIAVIIFIYRKKIPEAVGLLASVAGSAMAVFILKDLVARPRPMSPLPAYIETSYSFPSGHATLAIALYVFLLWAIYDAMPSLRKKLTVASTVVLVLAIGFSRLYLGVHYLSDVIAGYLLGGIFVVVGIKIATKLRERPTSALK
ncbi:MAG: phosphatase PAP2 family protein [Candidatus Kaiserbacteria bacterium]|nr:phosphatase PAP2 family protein [Candidatus Kaiserbacteria bacterium]